MTLIHLNKVCSLGPTTLPFVGEKSMGLTPSDVARPVMLNDILFASGSSFVLILPL